MADIKVKISRHGKFIKHSFERGSPSLSDIQDNVGDDAYYIVLGVEDKREYEEAKARDEREKYEDETKAAVRESAENVTWIKKR